MDYLDLMKQLHIQNDTKIVLLVLVMTWLTVEPATTRSMADGVMIR